MVLEDLQGLGDFSAVNGFENFSSPAMVGYDLATSVSNSSTSNLGTVSPHDLLLQDPFSAPNSAALTSLTSPSDFNDSPYGDSYDVSPNFGATDFDAANPDAWFPLFAQDATVAAAPVAGDATTSPASQSVDEINEPEVVAARRKSSHSRSPSTKLSSSAGVGAARRREKPLPPIVIDDPSDIIAMKRARNTLAARKSRERKAVRFDELEEKIAALEAERDHWKKLALSK
ncbi:cross-pathway control protein 1 [Ophiostoma piceae UAMH 11346]|uniref:Cross-pathway control protein 1 n=1 Tax=Ophiostoma piceae (strain UAMH 11346) TaxID=1262450 RepID=S3BPQ0_OPHP1|nr:cross-pathway control protein 1 [Ophiostoma piceae UAMH 11346]